jgi:hypothetical protein
VKRNAIYSIPIIFVLILSIGVVTTSAVKPIKTVLDVTLTGPVDGLVVENGGTIEVTGIITSLKGDAGQVDAYAQYAVGEGSTAFMNLGSSDTSVLHIISGTQPRTQSLLLDESYGVSWILAGPAGTYEIRIMGEGELARAGESESVTVRVLGAPPPPGVEVVYSEEQDASIGYGVATGTFENTYTADGVYEILSEGKNDQGTKKPVDDTTELGWIYTFDLPTSRTSTTFYFYGHALFEEDDGDTSFYVQEDLGGVWNTILEIQNTGQNKICYADLSDQTNQFVKLRFVDNDLTIGDKKISSLYIDQAYIGLDDYEPPMSGIEILTAPYTCHRFQTWENYGTAWYHDADIPITSGAATDIEIVDLDLDGRNEVVVAETATEVPGSGIIEIFDLDYGTAPVDTLFLPEGLSGAVICIAVGNFDIDPDIEIAGVASLGGAVIWDKVDGEYQVAFTIYERHFIDLVTAGNLDDDEELEIVFGFGWDPIKCDVVLYDYDLGLDTWMNTANYSDFTPDSWFYHMEINDVDNNDKGEIYVVYKDDPFHILTYTDGELIDFWTAPDVTAGTDVGDVGFSFVTGDVTNDGKMDLVIYTPYLDGSITGFRVFEYDELQGFVNTYDIYNPGMVNIFGDQMAIGDIDGDSVNELVVCGGPGGIYSEGKLYILRNTTLIFSADLNANESNCIVIGDYDNDA